MGVLALGIGSWYYFTNQPEWQTMIFTSFVFMQVFHALALHSGKESLFKTGLMGNPLLTGMAVLVAALQLIMLYVPALSQFFEITPLRIPDLSVAIFLGLIVMTVTEIPKRINK